MPAAFSYFSVEPGAPITLRLVLSTVEAKIAIVWPHDDAPVAEAGLANLTAYLTYPGSRVSVPCDLRAASDPLAGAEQRAR